jgi:hypothetical protein
MNRLSFNHKSPPMLTPEIFYDPPHFVVGDRGNKRKLSIVVCLYLVGFKYLP